MLALRSGKGSRAVRKPNVATPFHGAELPSERRQWVKGERAIPAPVISAIYLQAEVTASNVG